MSAWRGFRYRQALCLSIVGNATIIWNTVYTQRVLAELRAAGELITTSEIEHISPLEVSVATAHSRY